jgi:acyl-CoA thioesterase FadM
VRAWVCRNHQGNGVWAILTAVRGNLIVGAQTVRYRRELSFGEAYTLETRVLCWDDRAFYVEHRFCTRTATGGKFVNAIVLVKNSVLGPLKPAQLVEKLSGLSPSERESPAMPEDVSAWIKSNDLSSKSLRIEARL